MNAVLSYLNLISGTVHSKNLGLKECSLLLDDHFQEQRVDSLGLVGLQTAILETVVKSNSYSRNVLLSSKVHHLRSCIPAGTGEMVPCST